MTCCPALRISTPRQNQLTVHPTCSTTHLGLTSMAGGHGGRPQLERERTGAGRRSPASGALPGDRGLLHPPGRQLGSRPLRDARRRKSGPRIDPEHGRPVDPGKLVFRPQKNRTCEDGACATATGKPYESFVYPPRRELNQTTRANTRHRWAAASPI